MAFNLADILKDVSEPDTGREQIEYIQRELIDDDPNNFYQLTDLDGLAENISLCGLQQPIRVRQKEDGRYVIVSGHRRRAAIAMLAEDEPERWKEVSCIVERDAVSPSLQQLRLIYANASTRKLTSAEISEQAEQVEKLLYLLKEEGYEFPGRMRDHVAEAVGTSKTKLARLKVIRDNLAESWVDAWKGGTLTESQAHALAQMPAAWQDIIREKWNYSIPSLYADRIAGIRERFEGIQNIQCNHGLTACEHSVAMMEKSVDYNGACWRCCFECGNLQTCKNCCPEAAGKKKELRDVAKKASQEAKRLQEERDRPGAEFARLVWQRVGEARTEKRITVKQLFAAQKRFYSASVDDPMQRKMETGKGTYSPNTTLPFGYEVSAATVMKIRDVADALDCSVDFLLGRTDRMEVVSDQNTEPKPEKTSEFGTVWRTGKPQDLGAYVLLLQRDKYCTPKSEIWCWDGNIWSDCGVVHDERLDGKIVGWVPIPEVMAE